MPLSEVEKIAKEAKVAVAVDEAYYEFWGKTAVGLTERYDNLVVCRTFSKAFSMAGVRVGYLVAQRKTVEKLNIVRPPNSLSVISIMLAEAALRNLGEMRGNVRKIVKERDRVFKALSNMERVTPFPERDELHPLQGARWDTECVEAPQGPDEERVRPAELLKCLRG